MVGAVVAVACAGAVVTAAVARGDSSADGGPGLVAYGAPAAEVAQYWSDYRAALSPLLIYVRALPGSIAALRESGGDVSAAQAREAVAMAESFATARDLVSRIAVPAKVPAAVGELLQVACQLYRESALSLSELRGAGPGVSSDVVVRRSATLQAVGDRLIDQARRVLDIDRLSKDQTPAEFRYAPPVPSVSEVAGLPAAPLAGGVDVDRDLGEATALLGSLTSSGSAPSAASSGAEALLRLVTGLEGDPAQLSEDVVGARLALVVAFAAAQGPDIKGPASSESLLMLSNDIWNSARSLVSDPRASIGELPAPGLARSKVWTGGAFNGSPPPIKPGEGVGSGLRGGLPVVDPSAILKG